MRLILKYLIYPNIEKYYCDLTSELDKMARMNIHYILVDNYCKNNGLYAIRVLGYTVGAIYFDENNLITKITLDTNYIVRTYPADVLDQLQKYIGQRIEF